MRRKLSAIFLVVALVMSGCAKQEADNQQVNYLMESESVTEESSSTISTDVEPSKVADATIEATASGTVETKENTKTATKSSVAKNDEATGNTKTASSSTAEAKQSTTSSSSTSKSTTSASSSSTPSSTAKSTMSSAASSTSSATSSSTSKATSSSSSSQAEASSNDCTHGNGRNVLKVVEAGRIEGCGRWWMGCYKCVLCGVVISYTGEDEFREHWVSTNHTRTTKESTCTTKGVLESVCDACGEVIVKYDTPTIAHTYGDWIEGPPPTCLEGKRVDSRYCTMCGQAETKNVGMSPGAHNVEIIGTTPQDGFNILHYKCTVCGIEYDGFDATPWIG